MKLILSKMTGLGLSEYEAKTYLSLLRESPATAYEIGKHSGVPTSKIYPILKRLTDKGMISTVDDRKTKKYVPMDPDDFLNKHKSMTDRTVESLRKDLLNIQDTINLSSVWNITEYDYLMEKARSIIMNASGKVLISVWKEEFEQLEEPMRDALKRKVQVVTVHFGPTKIKPGQVYQHPIEDTIYQEKNGRGIVVVADSKEVLMGTILKYGRVEGAWSRNRGFVTVAEDYIKHDVYIMKIIMRYDRLLKERFGSRYEKLRDIFSDEEVL